MHNKVFLQIGNRKIGYEFEPLVIAELGINHGGSLSVAFEMVDAAVQAGAEIIKHQTHVVEDEMSRHAKNIIPGNARASIYEIMQQCALCEEDEVKLKDYIESKGLLFISTPFSRAAADRLERMNVMAYKIGSGECNNYPLLEHVTSFGKPIILSTGMNSIQNVEKAVNIFRTNKVPFALLHCTNVYPTPYHLVRLGALEELQKTFPDAVIGLSDHTVSNYPCLGAVALGASIVERHFTDHKQRIGPDIICSMDQKELEQLIAGAKALKAARGGQKGAVAEEKPTIDFAFASVVTILPIKAGELFTTKNIWVKRPGTGELNAGDFEKILGRPCLKDLMQDVQLKLSDVYT